MSQDIVTAKCFMCGKSFQMGPGIYDGKFISQYMISACKSCLDGNWDGWGPDGEDKLIAHLKDKGIAIPERNAKGWLPCT